MPTLPRLIATFRPQAWINKRAVDIDGAVKFDATEEILGLGWVAVRDFAYHNYDSDHLSSNLAERETHGGPFEVDVDLDEWLTALGVQDRSEMTEIDWAVICTAYRLPRSCEPRIEDCTSRELLPNEYRLEKYDESTTVRVAVTRGELCIYDTNGELLAAFEPTGGGLRLDVYGDTDGDEPTGTTIFEVKETA